MCVEDDDDNKYFNVSVTVGADVLRQEVINSKSTKTNTSTSCLFKLYFNCTQDSYFVKCAHFNIKEQETHLILIRIY